MGYAHVLLHLAFLLFAGVSAQKRGRDHLGDTVTTESTFIERMVKVATFFIHTKEHPNGTEINLNKLSPYIKPQTSTKIIVHGHISAQDEIQEIVKEYLKAPGKYNIITFPWTFAQDLPYTLAAKAMAYFGNHTLSNGIAKIGCMYDLKPHQVHLIGFNLGAHLAAVAAKKLNLTMGRLTGLDPSRLCFEIPCENAIYPGITNTSAEFVDIIHTSAQIDGFSGPIGTVDLYPNGGTFQPACDQEKDMSCNSIMSLKYFAESVKSNSSFLALLCPSQVKFLNSECKGFSTLKWYGTDNMETKTRAGSYFFETQKVSPYGMGEKGINP